MSAKVTFETNDALIGCQSRDQTKTDKWLLAVQIARAIRAYDGAYPHDAGNSLEKMVADQFAEKRGPGT